MTNIFSRKKTMRMLGVVRPESPTKGRATASRLAANVGAKHFSPYRAGSPKHTSVGQRPTNRQRHFIKAESLAHHYHCLCARLTALNTFFHANVGRCPTLVCLGLSALTARRDACALPCGWTYRSAPTIFASLRLCERHLEVNV